LLPPLPPDDEAVVLPAPNPLPDEAPEPAPAAELLEKAALEDPTTELVAELAAALDVAF